MGQRKTAIASLFLWFLLFQCGIAFAAEQEEPNVEFRLDLNLYETFDEIVEVNCENEENGNIQWELTPENLYNLKTYLPEGTYYFTLHIKNDVEGIDLFPMKFSAPVGDDYIQILTIRVKEAEETRESMDGEYKIKKWENVKADLEALLAEYESVEDERNMLKAEEGVIEGPDTKPLKAKIAIAAGVIAVVIVLAIWMHIKRGGKR